MAISRFFLSVALCAMLVATTGVNAEEVVDAGQADVARAELPADGPWYANHELPVRADGNLPGELRVFDESGNLVPARVRLFFLQDGETIVQTRPDEQGNFQVVGLTPGVYSVVAAGPEGFGAFSVRVLPATEPEGPPKTNTISDEKLREVSLTRARAAYAASLQASLVSAADARQAILIGAQELGVTLGGTGTGLGSSLGQTLAAGGVGGGSGGAGAALAGAIGAAGALMSSDDEQPTGPIVDPTQSPNTTGN